MVSPDWPDALELLREAPELVSVPELVSELAPLVVPVFASSACTHAAGAIDANAKAQAANPVRRFIFFVVMFFLLSLQAGTCACPSPRRLVFKGEPGIVNRFLHPTGN